jgi:hypothetical protein
MASSLANTTALAAPLGETQIKDAAVQACKAKSSLVNPSVLTSSTHFPEPDQVIALFIQGTKPPPSMKDQAGAELCLYSPQTKTARLAEWDAMAKTKNQRLPVKASGDF